MKEMNQRNSHSVQMRKNLLEKFNHCCASCGVKDDIVPLEIASLTPVSAESELSEDNMTILCPSCHMTFDRRPKEYEFINFLSGLLKNNSNFSNVRQEVLLGQEIRYRGDILVTRKEKEKYVTLLVECKAYLSPTLNHIKNIIYQLGKYKATLENCQMVLAVSSTLREKDLAMLSAANIEVWDMQYIAKHFLEQINKAPPNYYKVLLLSILAQSKKITREKELLNSLSLCVSGKTDWFVYQSLIGDIFEHLFTPPLGKPIPELSDKSRANRRDFIMPNYTDKGFWHFLREKYKADYIVIDAKNYTRKVKKAEVLQIANYLKSHGAGLFGLIATRKGGDAAGCEHTLREQWLVHQKMILILDDEDIKAMLMAKADGQPPEDILGQKIEQFRLSM